MLPITWLDILLLAIMLVSGLLAMIRGFLREVLSVVAWAAAAAACLMFYQPLLPLAESNIGSGTVTKVAVILGIFLLTLLVASIATARISDLVLDSRIGALDRSLGFVFGLARGLLIVVVAFHLFTWFVPANKLPEGVRAAKSHDVLQTTGQRLVSLLPPETANYVSSWLTSVLPRQPKNTDPDTPDGPPGKRSDRGGTKGATSSRDEQAGYDRSDRTDMRQLIQSTRQ